MVDSESLNVVTEHRTDQGIKVLYEKFLEQREYDQTSFFSNYLYRQIQQLNISKQSYLVVISGMATSNIGLQELPYGDMPFDAQGNGLKSKKMTLSNGLNVILISGVKNRSGMMRGEEIQAVGLSEHLFPHKNGILILPGTHSKHISYDNGKFTNLKSFMTGELFELLSQKSILANTVEHSLWGDERERAFQEGLQIGFAQELSSHLFYVRAKHILENSDKKDNYYMLSGMLIGDELSYLKTWDNPIFLAASEPFINMYKLALQRFIDKKQLVLFDSSTLEKSLLIGQLKILSTYGK